MHDMLSASLRTQVAVPGAPPAFDWSGALAGTARPRTAETTIIVGIGGARRNAAAAVCVDGRLQAVCEQERISRVRRAGIEAGGIPEHALDVVLRMSNAPRSEIKAVATAEDIRPVLSGVPPVAFRHHFAHAATAFFTSSFAHAVVLVCDRQSSPALSVWDARGDRIVPIDWEADGVGLAAVYSECAAIFGFPPDSEHRLEALARLAPGSASDRLAPYLHYSDGAVRVRAGWQAFVAGWLAEADRNAVGHRACVASSFQRRLGEILLMIVSDVRRRTTSRNICLAGGLFYNTYFNTVVHEAAMFDGVFVPPNPGNAGLAAGAALAAGVTHFGVPPRPEASPFLGPGFTLEEIKATLDNCKMSYECLHERELIQTTVDALTRGLMVGWFQGRMEWGPRALGNRSILASPLSPYVLDNLNTFLKQRERYRAYGLSVREEERCRFFAGPAHARYMEYDYRIIAPDVLQHVVPPGVTTLRVHTVANAPDPYRSLLDAFAHATGVGVLVNTSFNGFNEPIVCSPRDAIRVFFGTGLDMAVIGRFVIRK